MLDLSKCVPDENIQAYRYLYCIETGLRELIIESLQALEGPQWYRKRLPADVLEKYRKARQIETQIRWQHLIPYHPMYYVDFADLRKVLERDDNWRQAFGRIIQRKEFVSVMFAQLELIRNKIAHNRKVRSEDVDVVRLAFMQLSEEVGIDHFIELCGRYTSATDILKRLAELRVEGENAFEWCTRLQKSKPLDVWSAIRDAWWFEGSYLDHSLAEITIYFEMLEAYDKLPRTRGSGYVIESWVKNSDIERKHSKAKNEFEAILNRG